MVSAYRGSIPVAEIGGGRQVARWNSRMMVTGLTALDGRAMPQLIALLSMIDTSDTTLNTARWWPVEPENDMGEGNGVAE